MSDNEKDSKPKETIAEADKSANQQKLTMVRELKKMTPDSPWTITQQILQEVIATYIIENPSKKLPKSTILIESLKLAIEERYKDDQETKDFVLSTIPHYVNVNLWLRKEGWEEAVWSHIKDTGLFNKERRAAMIDALYKRGMEKDTMAAKIYLQMSGDFVEKSEVTSKDATIDKFREINTILHKKKTSVE